MSYSVHTGMRLGKFEILGRLGSGGAGAVYRAKNVEDGREVALKTLMPGTANNEEIYKRFVREITVAQKLRHENVVGYDDCGLHEDVLFYTMELVSWGSLDEVLKRRGTITWQETVECGIHICHGLGHLHQHNVVHRDLKPANIFLSDDGRLKIGDFGLARDLDSGRLTIDGQTVGTAKYLAPEQAKGESDLDGRTDLYGLGCILFEMLAARPPFISDDPYSGSDYVRLMQKHVETPPPKVDDFAANCPKALSELIDRLLAKEPHDRPNSAEVVAVMLTDILENPQADLKQIDTPTNEPPAEALTLTERLQQSHSPARKVNVKALIVLAIVAAVGIALAIFAQGPK